MEDIKIKEIIERHQHWLRRDCDKWENMRADLRGAYLCGADLHGTNLCEADLRGANLYGADLRGTNLYKADLRGANLCVVNLCGADLCEADLCGANLRETNLRGANLRETDLCGADLYRTDLYGANLYGANLYKADLRRANLRGADNVPFIPYVCPDFGAFTGFKKAHDLIVMLEIPEDARRLSATGRKCRCDKAKVIDIQNIDGTKANVIFVSSDRDNNFIYKIGEEVRVLDFDEDRWNECSTGIHFFINRQEAVDYI